MRDKRYSFLDDLFAFLDDAIESGAEVHVVDRSDPNDVVEHVFNVDEEEEINVEIPFCDEDEPKDCNSADCDTCPYAGECEDGEEYDVPLWGIPDIDRIVFSEPATIVFWMDGTKTVVKCMKGEKFERYAGFLAACAKKMFGSTSRAKAIMNYFTVEQAPKLPKKTKPDVTPSDIREAYDEVIANHESIKEAVNEALER